MIELDGVEYYSVDEVCELLGVKPATIYAYVSRGVLKSYKQRVGRASLYRRDEVDPLRQVQEPARQRSTAQESEQSLADELPEAAAWMAEL